MAKAKTAQEFDRRFDEGEDIFDLADIDEESIRRPGLESQRINLNLPRHFLEKLDREAEIRGITRQSLIKTWLFDRLEGSKPEAKPEPFKAGHRLQTLKGVIERAWPNDYQGKRAYFAKVKERGSAAGLLLQTTDKELGEALLLSVGQEIEAKAKPVPENPGKFWLKSFERVGQGGGSGGAQAP
jgi:hypothetical protein